MAEQSTHYSGCILAARTVAVSLLCAIVLTACGGGGGSGGTDADPFVEDAGIAFVRRPLAVDDEGELVQPDVREALVFNPGADLFYRELSSPSAPQRNLTASLTGGQGDVKDVEVSWDGKRLLFAMRAPEIEGAAPEDQPTWNIWEYDTVSDDLRRIIASDITAEDGHDVAPHYLPDGRIIFSSTRQRRSRAVLVDEDKPQFEALDEDRNERALVLHVMDADGGNIRQISYNQSHDLDPSVLDTGEVIFSRWENMGGRDALSLYRMRPDGTDLQLLYGAHSHDTGTGDVDVHFLQPRQRDDGRVIAVLQPLTDSYGGGDLVLIDVENYIDNNQPIAPNAGISSGPGQRAATVNDVRTDDTISPGGRFSSVWPLHDGTDRMLVSWSACRLQEGSRIVPCTQDRLGDPDAVEADPLYGIFLYDREQDSQLPVVVPEEGIMFSDVVATEPRRLPAILFDAMPGVELDARYIAEDVGVLNIRSVYDLDGVDTADPAIATLADPAQTRADERPARFLRIIKAVGIPDREVLTVPRSAFGASTANMMREIIGYVPVQPDGSVRVKVPAQVPLAISVVDREGRRFGRRHRFWLQLRAGETVSCNGCHNHATGLPHGHQLGPPSVWAGSAVTGLPFPNTDPALFTDFGETMAETLTRIDETVLLPDYDLIYEDIWTDETAAGRPADAPFTLAYADLATPVPNMTPGCDQAWNSLCRTVINYEEHIHPLWSLDRGAATCTNCHTSANGTRVPDAQLELTDGPSPDMPAHLHGYRELLIEDFEQDIINGALQDILVDGIVEETGQPGLVPVPVRPPMSTAGAFASQGLVNAFREGGSHDGRLSPAELRLVYEWLDIGAQYWNDPFAVPP